MNQYPSPNPPGYWQQANVVTAPDAANTGTGVTYVTVAATYRGTRVVVPKPISIRTISFFCGVAIGTPTDTYNLGLYEARPGVGDAVLLAASNGRNDLGAIGAKNVSISPTILLPGRVYYSLLHQRLVTTTGAGVAASQWNNSGWVGKSLDVTNGDLAALGYSLATGGALGDVDLPSTLALGPMPAGASPSAPIFFFYP